MKGLNGRCSATRARVTTDGQFPPRAIAQVLGTDVQHRVSGLTNRIEQDHRGIKQRYYPMLGFGARSAKRYRQAFDEVRNYSSQPDERFVSLSEKRQLFVNRV